MPSRTNILFTHIHMYECMYVWVRIFVLWLSICVDFILNFMYFSVVIFFSNCLLKCFLLFGRRRSASFRLPLHYLTISFAVVECCLPASQLCSSARQFILFLIHFLIVIVDVLQRLLLFCAFSVRLPPFLDAPLTTSSFHSFNHSGWSQQLLMFYP